VIGVVYKTDRLTDVLIKQLFEATEERNLKMLSEFLKRLI